MIIINHTHIELKFAATQKQSDLLLWYSAAGSLQLLLQVENTQIYSEILQKPDQHNTLKPMQTATARKYDKKSPHTFHDWHASQFNA